MSKLPMIIGSIHPDTLEKAKHMYFSGIYPTEIAEDLEIDINDLGYLIFGIDKSGNDPSCWLQERKQRPDDSFVTFRKVKPYILSQTEQKLTKHIIRSVDHMVDDGTILDIDGIKKATDTLEKIDKIGRLERGESTENINLDQGFTLRDIQNGVTILDGDDYEVIDDTKAAQSEAKARINNDKSNKEDDDERSKSRRPFQFPK